MTPALTKNSPAAFRPDHSAAPAVKAGIPRLLEIVLALIGLILSAPLLALAVVAIALSSRGPAIFRQQRIGYRGRRFTLYKLRTMRATPELSLQVTAADDSRILPVGRWLRRAKLDELPELWNVLKGDMSLVGPRPEVERYVDLNNPIWRMVLEAKPGITDPVTLSLRNEEALMAEVNGDREDFYLNTLQPIKLQGYLEYQRGRSFRQDLKILCRTFSAVALPNTAPVPKIMGIAAQSDNGHAKGSPAPTSNQVDVSENGNGYYDYSYSIGRPMQFVIDFLILVIAFALAYLLRFDFVIPQPDRGYLLVQLAFVVLIQFGLLSLTGVYTFIWRYVGMAELRTFLKAALCSVFPILIMRIALPESYQALRVPLSIILVDTILAFGGVLGARVWRRGLYEAREKRQRANGNGNGKKKRVLLIGAGRAGVMVAKEIQNRTDMDLHIAGFVDDAPEKQASVIHGVKVLGSTQDLPILVRVLNIDHVIVSMAQATREDFRRILDICETIPVKVRTIPGLYEILQGRVNVSRIRDVQIEDLLGREPVQLDEEQMGPFLAGKVVMVTGAGGSIGSELARQVARFRPATLLLVERAEFALFSIDRELRGDWPELQIIPLVADVGQEPRMRSVFESYGPQLVLHAAAHKHVPMMETNATEAVRNNVFATNLLGRLAGEFKVETFVLVSTDKAVRPTSMMGASKRMAELVIQHLDRNSQTRYLAVRFGNVIGSTGSVIPIFSEQIRKGGPVTVTHPEMTRYFMTIPEAAQLVLQAGAMGQGGEIFILNMGEPVRILDLAKAAITLSGLKPFADIDIVFTGVRSGEKLFEELELTEEQMSKTRHPKIFIGKIAAYPSEKIQMALERLAALLDHETDLRLFLNDFLEEANLRVCAETATNSAHVRVRAAGATQDLPVVG
jgi:FlaA1/EpsC-like NDP-sugar epimerase/lipopolysaccharide/colanic/teichoic acid biosynthesis glycosyltransferase